MKGKSKIIKYELGRAHLPDKNGFEPIESEKLLLEIEKKDLTNPRKRATIRTTISYRSVPGKRGPEFVRLADLQSPPHK